MRYARSDLSILVFGLCYPKKTTKNIRLQCIYYLHGLAFVLSQNEGTFTQRLIGDNMVN